MDKVRLERTRIIYAFPTVGKTHLCKCLSVRGVFAVDMDDAVRVVCPTFFERKPWRTKTDPKVVSDFEESVYAEAGRVCRNVLDARRDAICVTNRYMAPIRTALAPYLSEGRFPIGVFRESAKEVVALTVSRGDRGGPPPVGLIQKWITRLEQNRSLFIHLIALPPSDPPLYLSDVVTPAWSNLLPEPAPFPTVSVSGKPE